MNVDMNRLPTYSLGFPGDYHPIVPDDTEHIELWYDMVRQDTMDALVDFVAECLQVSPHDVAMSEYTIASYEGVLEDSYLFQSKGKCVVALYTSMGTNNYVWWAKEFDSGEALDYWEDYFEQRNESSDY